MDKQNKQKTNKKSPTSHQPINMCFLFKKKPVAGDSFLEATFQKLNLVIKLKIESKLVTDKK